MVESILRRALVGSAAGAAATGAMTVPMLLLRATDRIDEMAPERVTDSGLGMVRGDQSKKEHVVATTFAHVAFGVGAGAVYAVLQGGRRCPWWAGSAYGLAVAAASYQGWVPATTTLPRLSRAPTGRRQEVLVSHVVYGTVLAVVAGRLSGAQQAAASGEEAS